MWAATWSTVSWLIASISVWVGRIGTHPVQIGAVPGPGPQPLATSGAVVGLCPITEANLGDGLFCLGASHRAGAVAAGAWASCARGGKEHDAVAATSATAKPHATAIRVRRRFME